MVGVVVTGHGGFAAGMAANVKMLAGSDAEVKAVDFADGMDVEVFESSWQRQSTAMQTARLFWCWQTLPAVRRTTAQRGFR